MVSKITNCVCCTIELKDPMAGQRYCKNCAWYIRKIKERNKILENKVKRLEKYKNTCKVLESVKKK